MRLRCKRETWSRHWARVVGVQFVCSTLWDWEVKTHTERCVKHHLLHKTQQGRAVWGDGGFNLVLSFFCLSLHLSAFSHFYPISPSLSLSTLMAVTCFLVGEVLCVDRAAELINEMHCCTAGPLLGCLVPWPNTHTTHPLWLPRDSVITAVKDKRPSSAEPC